MFRELAAGADMLFAGDDEARIALEIDDPDKAGPEELAAALAELGPREVVIKRGRRGATALIDGKLVDVPAVPVHIVDSVGAGDAFVAGYLACRLTGRGAGRGAAHRGRHRRVRGDRAGRLGGVPAAARASPAGREEDVQR